MLKFAIVQFALLAAASALPSTLIIGGEDAKQGDIPHQIRITVDNVTICGGSLIVVNNTQLVLTAAECAFATGNLTDYRLIAGDLQISNSSGREQQRVPTQRIFHEDFDSETKYGNIALFAIRPAFNLTDDVQPIALPKAGQNTTGNVRISGWGAVSALNAPEVPHDHLQKLELSVVSDEKCLESWQRSDLPFRPLPSMICAQSGTGKTSHCALDVGGPVSSVNGSYLAGIVSWPQDDYCMNVDTGLPDVFIEVSHYVDWIIEQASKL